MKTNLSTYTILLLTAILSACGKDAPPKSITPETQKTLSEAFEEIRQGHKMPALAGIFVKNYEVTQSAVVGQRSTSDTFEATMEDKWHVGSLTKAMTSVLTARLIEQGILNWDTTIGEVFPILAADIHPNYAMVTIRELLSHTGGILADISRIPNWSSYFGKTEKIQAIRLEMVAEILQFSPENNRGTFKYSNAGYVIAGAMLEALTLEDWETLIQNEVFLPLGIEDAGFGAPGNGTDQPKGHKRQSNQWQSVNPQDPGSDNPKAMGPAGTVHMSLHSLAKLATAHIQGYLGNSDFLSQESFTILHQPQSNGKYALGWFRNVNSISHDGTNTMWFAKIGIDLQAGIAAVAVTNAGGDEANIATDDAIKAMLARVKTE